MVKETKPKIVFESEIECPHCKRTIRVRKTKTLVHAAEKAEYDEEISVEMVQKEQALDKFEK